MHRPLPRLASLVARPRNYRELIHSQYCYYPTVATYINNVYVLVEAIALAMVLCEILVAYGAVGINSFLQTNNPDFYVGRGNSIFNLSYLDYAVGFNSAQYSGWAYMSWSLVRFVGIARRQRQRWIRKIKRLDDEGTEIIENKIQEALLDNRNEDVYSVKKKKDEGKTKRRESSDNGKSDDNDGGNEGGKGIASSIRRRLTMKTNNKTRGNDNKASGISEGVDAESPKSDRPLSSSRTSMHINFSMDSATGPSTNTTSNRPTPVHQQIALPKPPPNSSARAKVRRRGGSPEQASPLPSRTHTFALGPHHITSHSHRIPPRSLPPSLITS
jgi:hypothetical protein